jgi:hypothetical protein
VSLKEERDTKAPAENTAVHFSLATTNDPASAVAYLQTAALQHFDEEYVSGLGEDGLSCK